MKIFKSIKWRLQLWYGLILVVVLAGFGGTAYQLERGRQLGRIDNELNRRVGILANVLHRPPRGPGLERGPGQGRPPLDRFEPSQPPDATQPEPFMPGPDNPPARTRFHLPPEAEHLFETNDPNGFYFVIFLRSGKELARSANQPDRIAKSLMRISQTSVNTLPQLPGPERRPRTLSFFENYREAGDTLPSGESIWVGCSIAQELKELHHTAVKLAGVGGIILFFGLAGGWWIVFRSLRPVGIISSAAVKISAGDLSQRISVPEAESELGQLAVVLNSTFARLEAAFAEQRQFTSDAAHELRTPVSVIITQTQTTLNRERDAASYRETVEACQRAAQRMRKLIESLLALARFDAGQEVLKRLRFDLSHTLDDCINLVKPLADERGVKITAEIPSLQITGDSERLAQVVTNLLTNAIQYNQPEGEVRVKLESQAGLAVLTIADTGQGITAENLPRVFERFYRADQSRTGAGNAGLGLSICKAIVEAHGGTIEAASELSVGTTFTVRLPG